VRPLHHLPAAALADARVRISLVQDESGLFRRCTIASLRHSHSCKSSSTLPFPVRLTGQPRIRHNSSARSPHYPSTLSLGQPRDSLTALPLSLSLSLSLTTVSHVPNRHCNYAPLNAGIFEEVLAEDISKSKRYQNP
jgi:hypothetical protein